MAFHIQIDKNTGLERDDWWYLYNKERGVDIPKAPNSDMISTPLKQGSTKPRFKSSGMYQFYSIEEAIEMTKEYGETHKTVAKHYGIAYRTLISDINLYNKLNKDVEQWFDVKAWMFYCDRFSITRTLDRLQMTEEHYRKVILWGKAGKYDNIRKYLKK